MHSARFLPAVTGIYSFLAHFFAYGERQATCWALPAPPWVSSPQHLVFPPECPFLKSHVSEVSTEWELETV